MTSSWVSMRSFKVLVCVWLVVGILAVPGSVDATVTGVPAALPEWPIAGVSDVALEPATALFHLVHNGGGKVSVHDATGLELRSYGVGVLSAPVHIGFSSSRAYVTDLADRVEFFDLVTGASLGGWGGAGSAVGQFNDPWGIEVNNNEVYVSDSANARIQVFTVNGAWMRTIDGAATAFQLISPRGLTVHNGVLYVVDSGLDAVVKFDPFSGGALGSIPLIDTNARGIEITTAGDVFVSTLFNDTIEVYTTAGVYQVDWPTPGGGEGLAVDPSGNSLWVADFANSAIRPYTYLKCAGLTPTVVGTSYDDTFVTGASIDIVALDAGADDVRLGAGGDIACGGAGSDTIRGEAGSDTLFGGLAADFLLGGADADSLHGEAGADDLRGGGGGDSIFGGDGPDTIKGQGGADMIDGGAAADTIDGQGAGDTINGGAGNDIINGQNGADVMTGGSGADRIKGNTGPDTIHGDADDDELFGGEGADTLYGGPGFDKCSGNTGPDSAESATCEQTPGVETLF